VFLSYRAWNLGSEIKKLTVTPAPRVIDVSSLLLDPVVGLGRPWAGPARLGDTPDGQRVDPFSVDDVDAAATTSSAMTSPRLPPGGFLTVIMRTP
jgi:hypothetical protein